MNVYKISLIIVCLASNFINGEEWISHVLIKGHNKVKDKIILREIKQNIPGKFDKTIAEEDRNRIYNLGLFSTVEVFPQDSIYMVNVMESLSIIPFPIIDFDEAKGVQGWTYGGAITLLNFRGLNQKLSFGYAEGANKMQFISFSDPWIIGDHVSIDGDYANIFVPNAVYDYNLSIKYLSTGFGFYKNLFNKFKFNSGINEFDVKIRYNSGSSLKTTPSMQVKKYNYIFSSFKYIYDTRDIYKDPNHGVLWYNNFNYYYGIKNTTSLSEYKFFIKKFYSLKNWKFDPVLSITFMGEFISGKNIPIFKRKYLGGEGKVRGYSPVPINNSKQVVDKIEIEQYILNSIQLQYTIIEKKDLGKIEFGIDGVFFTDYGFGSFDIKNMQLNNGIFGYGIGLRVFLSSINFIGIDLGFNPFSSYPKLHLSSYKEF